MSQVSVRLNNLNEEISAIQRQMFHSVKAQHGQISEVFDCANDSERALKELTLEVEEVLSTIDDPSGNITGVLQQSSAEFERIQNKIRSTKSIIKALETISEIHRLFSKADDQLRQWEFEEACNSVLAVCELLGTFPGGATSADKSSSSSATSQDQDGAEVLRLIKRQMRCRRTALESQLRVCLGQAVVVDTGTLKIARVLRGTQLGRLCSREEVPTKEFLGTLDRLDLLDDVALDLTNRIWQLVVGPLLFSAGKAVPSPDLKKTGELTTLTFRPRSSGVSAASGSSRGNASSQGSNFNDADVVTPELCIDRSLVVLGFLADELWSYEVSLVSRMSGHLGRKTGKIMSTCMKALEHHLPKEIDQLQQYMGLAEKCNKFDQRLAEWGYLRENETGALGAWLSDCPLHFANKKRGQLLTQARALMVADYHNSVEVTDVTERGTLTAMPGAGKKGKGGEDNDRVFFLPTCHVSLAAQELVEMAHQTMIQATRSQQDLARTLYRTARDILDIFRAVVPLAHADAITTVPRLGALFHNDCLYIAHHLLTMAYLYRPKLPAPLNRIANMVDMVPAFRELGERYLRSQIDRQRKEVLLFLDDVRILGLSEDEERDLAEAAIRKVVYHSRQLAQAWQAVLPADVFARSMGAVLEAVISHLMKPVLAAQEFSEEETHFLHQLFGTLIQVEDVFKNASVACSSSSSWSKFKALAALMDYSLDNISELLPKGAFRDFTVDELGSLLRAIFQESSRRAAILATIHKI